MSEDIPLWKLKQEARDYIAKCDAEHGTGGLTMDIKARIDALTEAEAKAALYWAIQRVAVYGSCFVCDRNEKCQKDDGVDCDIEFLRQSLEEV